MRNGSLLHRSWQLYAEAAALATGLRGPSLQVWRPVCWRAGRHENYYGSCVLCGKALA